MARPSPPREVDTVVIGNGPSALLLSYILHGHSPYYVGGHHDPILHAKLVAKPNLLDLAPDRYAHFQSSLRYSTQALPVNTLLDTLIRPNADTEVNPTPCVEWRSEPAQRVPHVVVGATGHAGGQWAEETAEAEGDVGTLSYAEMLSLPGYTYSEHLAKSQRQQQCDFVRPSRREVADYLRAYPAAVGIEDAVYTRTRVDGVKRDAGGFWIGSLGIKCKHLVLASGIFTVNIPPPALLEPLTQLHIEPSQLHQEPLLVIGSGFSAADVIIAAPPNRNILHIFQWAPDSRPSPLKGCHHTAYPEYAAVYRQMKLAAIAAHKSVPVNSPLMRRKSNPFFRQRDWSTFYEGLPNASVLDVSVIAGSNTATVTLQLASGETVTRRVSGLEYVVGRRGSLDYLSSSLRSEVLGTDVPASPLISGRTLRAKAEMSLEVARDVFIIGSLAGDSLIRHAVGGCVFTAGRILGHIPPTRFATSSFPSLSSSHPSSTSDTSISISASASASASASSRSTSPSPNLPSDSLDVDASSTKSSNSSTPLQTSTAPSADASPSILANGHSDLHLDRRKLALAVEVASVQNRVWRESGWWAGGLGPASMK
ncbi:hypothetical protein P154DRAFT_252777 [Amniculicola lignicola CBS 123094]|uniref:FAD/NAD(P)-binding domain-containing protein n=1 Tax=Amniculicola lignicola CBS 123094 TaxID=1392246 RepID=A0A6A5WLB7_9PLEO|nr:hypothetical protein P154DRAFT_252777 [Amniculicola lignicola CBS 123094]